MSYLSMKANFKAEILLSAVKGELLETVEMISTHLSVLKPLSKEINELLKSPHIDIEVAIKVMEKFFHEVEALLMSEESNIGENIRSEIADKLIYIGTKLN